MEPAPCHSSAVWKFGVALRFFLKNLCTRGVERASTCKYRSMYIANLPSLSANVHHKICICGIKGINTLNPELNPTCYLLALLGAHHFLHVSRIRVKSLTFRRLMSYIYIYTYIYMEHPFLMFLDHTQRRSTVGRTPLDE